MQAAVRPAVIDAADLAALTAVAGLAVAAAAAFGAATVTVGAATEAAFARATHRVRLTSSAQRVTGVHMEPRAVVAAWDEAEQLYTVHASHGIGVVQMRDELAVVLGVPKERVRVVAPPPLH